MKLSKEFYLEEKAPIENERVLIWYEGKPLIVDWFLGQFICTCCCRQKAKQIYKWQRIIIE